MPNQESSNQSKLCIYKASAGSGKTYTLTKEYLSLLLDAQTPFAYHNILAVTFTNKATDEMKTRIVSELAKLANNESSNYIDFLTKKHNLNEEKLRIRAKEILNKILHDYSSFSVNTIDKFFQQTMRAFTREIGLNGSYNVELDSSRVLEESVDELLSDLEKNENKDLLDWLIRFSSEKVEDGKRWNIKTDILDLAQEIFKEDFKNYRKDVQSNIQDKKLMDAYKNRLIVIIKQFENKLQQLGEKGLNIIHQNGLKTTDFKGGQRSAFNYFNHYANKDFKEPTATFINLMSEPANWLTKTASEDVKSKVDTCYESLNTCIIEIVEVFSSETYIFYNTAKEINRFFYTLGILGDVDNKIRAYSSENNIMLISDTNELLNSIIDENDTPFIYEKLGQRYNHFMIDEFQDTSGMQWKNFKPLLKESIAGNNLNFIVGDVKQSIYRWRNSDWNLLDSQLDEDFKEEGINHQSLQDNWRSAPNIIKFNNSIFSTGAKILQSKYNEDLPNETDPEYALLSKKIEKAYQDILQEIPNQDKDYGYVNVEFLETGKDTDWKEEATNKIPQQLELLQDKGFQLKDIAILVRTKNEGAKVAECLLNYKNEHPNSSYRYDIISDEALYIKNAKSIKLIIAILSYIINPDNAAYKTIAIFEYFKYKEKLNEEEALKKYFSEGEAFPIELEEQIAELKKLALYEMVEATFELFDEAIETNEQIYIQAFMDMVLDYTTRHSSDLYAFLKWWEETGSQKTVFTPDGQDAVRIMTIHKSKGLGFEAVIIPYCEWDIDHKFAPILWCLPKCEPFDTLKIVPVKYGKKLQNTIFNREYYKEKLNAYIDNINILYVAFTRAKKALLISAPQSTSTNVAMLLKVAIEQSVTSNKHLINLLENFDEEKNTLLLDENYTLPKPSEVSLNKDTSIKRFSSTSFKNRIKIELNNKYFFKENKEKDYGILLHDIISNISTKDDIERAVNKFYIEGSITKEEVNTITKQLEKFVTRKNISAWYDGSYKISNEIQILQANGYFLRPDRVMIKENEVIVIDYKFGEKELNKYHKQVANYINKIKEIGYSNVKGYLCYMKLDKVVEIK